MCENAPGRLKRLTLSARLCRTARPVAKMFRPRVLAVGLRALPRLKGRGQSAASMRLANEGERDGAAGCHPLTAVQPDACGRSAFARVRAVFDHAQLAVCPLATLWRRQRRSCPSRWLNCDRCDVVQGATLITCRQISAPAGLSRMA